MFEKKRWFDGLHDIYAGKDEFEIKLGLFGGDGGEGGGGTPTKGTNAINRGTVGLTAAEMNARADAQERGGRQSAGVAGPSSRQDFSRSPSNFGAMSPEEIASEAMASSSDRFTTSTEGAYRDLDRRADVGQIDPSIGVIETPFGSLRTPTSAALSAVNKFGMNRAQDIRDQIRGGGVPVTDRFGRIQGVVSEGTGPVAAVLGAFGLNRNVYTGGSSFAPSTSQLMSYRPDPTRQGIASLPYADVQMPTTTRAQPLSQPLSMQSAVSSSLKAPPQYDVNLPPYLANYDLDAKKAAIEAMIRDNKGAIPADLIQGGYLPASTSGIQRSSQPVTTEPLDRDLMTDALMRGVNNPQSNLQYGTINDPTAQAGVFDGIGDFFTETVPGFFDYSAPAKAKSNADRFKDSRVRTKPTGIGEFGRQIYEAVTGPFTG